MSSHAHVDDADLRSRPAVLPLKGKGRLLTGADFWSLYLRRVAVRGPNAAVARTLGGGSATVFPPYTVSFLDGLRAALGAGLDATIGWYGDWLAAQQQQTS